MVVFRQVALAAAITGLFTACASTNQTTDDGFSRAVTRTSAGLDDVALQPLSDLNLRRVEIPPLLLSINSPYEPIPVMSCGAIAATVNALTEVLGPDSDAPGQGADSFDQIVGDEAANLALGTISSAMSDMIPFRSVVRYASGANAHARNIRAAFERGIQRRAYLKGVGASIGCAPPAAPDPSAGLRPPLPPRR